MISGLGKGRKMKIDRLIGILSILLQNEKVTAPSLAEKFEVSRRTINRDVIDLCMAGIPIVTTQGQNGGISIMEGYKIDRTLLTSFDMQAILAGLKSLDSVSGTNRYQQLMEKLKVGTSSVLTSNNHISIDLSSWYKQSLAPKIESIQSCIEKKHILSFTYHGPTGESFRRIEPYILVFKWSSWYVKGFCLGKGDFRLFKLNRMTGVKVEEDSFVPRRMTEEAYRNDYVYGRNIHLTALFSPAVKWRLIDEYGVETFQELENGKLLFEYTFAEKEGMFSWLLTFRNEVEILEPEEIRNEFKDIINQIIEIYQR
ncbi:putative DNA-binding transcriptional regulator YafY [Aequitasia blattaphilus]